jgi:hypothetical protein
MTRLEIVLSFVTITIVVALIVFQGPQKGGWGGVLWGYIYLRRREPLTKNGGLWCSKHRIAGTKTRRSLQMRQAVDAPGVVRSRASCGYPFQTGAEYVVYAL